MLKNKISISVFCIFFIFLSCPPLEEDTYDGPTTLFSVAGMTDISIDFEVPSGKGIHEVRIYFDTNENQTTVTFSLTVPGESANTMTLGLIYDTNAGDSNDGFKYQVTEPTASSGNFELHIWAKPLPPATPGTFGISGSGIWNFSVNNLNIGSSVDGEIKSYDTNYSELSENSSTPEYDIAGITDIE